MSRFDSFQRQLSIALHKIFILLQNLYKEAAVALKMLQRQSSFLLNKQKILHTIYTPIIQTKLVRSQQLLNDLHSLKTEQTAIRKHSASLSKQNETLAAKIKLMQDLLLGK